MKSRVLILLLSTIICLSVCFFSNYSVRSIMDIMIYDAEKTEAYIKSNKLASAFSVSQNLKDKISRYEQLLESLVPHDDLHDLSIQIEDVALSIAIDDMDDCKKALALLKENAEHLIKHESLSLANIF